MWANREMPAIAAVGFPWFSSEDDRGSRASWVGRALGRVRAMAKEGERGEKKASWPEKAACTKFGCFAVPRGLKLDQPIGRRA